MRGYSMRRRDTDGLLPSRRRRWDSLVVCEDEEMNRVVEG